MLIVIIFHFHGQIFVDVKEEEWATVITFKYQLPFFYFLLIIFGETLLYAMSFFLNVISMFYDSLNHVNSIYFFTHQQSQGNFL